MMLLILLLAFLFLLYGFYLWIIARDYRHLPGNFGNSFPIIGNLYTSLRHSFFSPDGLNSMLEKIINEYGGICCTFVYHKPTVVISDPLILEELVSHPAFSYKEPFVYESLSTLWKGPFSIACPDKEWKLRRKELTNTLRQSNLNNYHGHFVEVSRQIVDQMKRERGGVIDLKKYSMCGILNCITETHYGYNIADLDQNEFYSTFNRLEPLIASALVGNPLAVTLLKTIVYMVPPPVFNSLSINCIQKASSVLENHKFIIDNHDVLYSEAVIKRNYSRNKKSLEEIRPEIIDLIFVATHTVSIVCSSALVYLATLPEIQEKVWLEQDEIFGDSDRDPAVEDVRRMEYLDRVLKETLRMIIAPFSARKMKSEINIDGTVIPKGATVLVCTRLVSMDERFWENPLKFDPDRHLKQDQSKIIKQLSSGFGFGTRDCPGSQYGLNVMKVFISSVLRKYKLVSDIKYEDIKLKVDIFMKMEGGYKVSLIRRSI